MKLKQISVIITTYNTRKYLEKAINGILGQTYKNFGIVIIDDNSSDDTYEYVLENYRQYNIRIFKNRKIKALV